MVIYEVNLVIDVAIEGSFDAWLPEHILEMLQVAGFDRAQTMTSESTDARVVHRTVWYEVRDMTALETYFDTQASTMRAAGLAAFGDAFRASRRILTPKRVRPAS
jgi:hypothetical protein